MKKFSINLYICIKYDKRLNNFLFKLIIFISYCLYYYYTSDILLLDETNGQEMYNYYTYNYSSNYTSYNPNYVKTTYGYKIELEDTGHIAELECDRALGFKSNENSRITHPSHYHPHELSDTSFRGKSGSNHKLVALDTNCYESAMRDRRKYIRSNKELSSNTKIFHKIYEKLERKLDNHLKENKIRTKETYPKVNIRKNNEYIQETIKRQTKIDSSTKRRLHNFEFFV
jgi:hypothetical protein